jgi:prepilin signal peptidase PulO-like enzyme (type II secretory pathway)
MSRYTILILSTVFVEFGGGCSIAVLAYSAPLPVALVGLGLAAAALALVGYCARAG